MLGFRHPGKSGRQTRMDLILVRHGGVDAPAGLCLGHTDVPLSAEGFTATQRLAASWDGAAPRFLFASDLKRAQQSAQQAAQGGSDLGMLCGGAHRRVPFRRPG